MHRLVKHYEECFRKYGDNHKGVDWPNEQDIQTRYKVMIEGIPHSQSLLNNNASILDYGCGLGHFYEYLTTNNLINGFQYSGCDASLEMIKHCKNKFPTEDFFTCDIDGTNNLIAEFDYIVCNGVFTEKRDYSFDEMFAYSMQLIASLFSICTHGLAVNFMSANVDWERGDLFHLPFDKLISFVSNNLSRHFIIRNDYALYEYTIYIYKNPFPGVFRESRLDAPK